MKKVLIVGGGFGGIKCALELGKRVPENLEITLVSDKPHFEYHAALYRVVTGRTPLEVCIPLEQIFENYNVKHYKDRVSSIDLTKKTVTSENEITYKYDYLVLALGSETIYFNLEGLEEFSFGFKSINEAIRLKNHLHKSLDPCIKGDETQVSCASHVVVVGGGASGTELAGELAWYFKKLSKMHGFDESKVKIDLIERGKRLVPQVPEEASQRLKERLESLGVNVMLETEVLKEDMEKLYLKGSEIETKTVIWTAGAKANSIYSSTPGFSVNGRGQVDVDEYLEAKGAEDVFVIGDAASTKHSGMAQTALFDGEFVAKNLIAEQKGTTLTKYDPPQPVYSIPAGQDWAVYSNGAKNYYGKFGWYVRRYLDLKIMLSILPIRRAITAFKYDKVLCETCEICDDKD